MRIWHQSFTVLDDVPHYRDALVRHMNGVASPPYTHPGSMKHRQTSASTGHWQPFNRHSHRTLTHTRPTVPTLNVIVNRTIAMSIATANQRRASSV